MYNFSCLKFCLSVRFGLYVGLFSGVITVFKHKMSVAIRKRNPNWMPSEKELLISLVELHFQIIENKKTDGVSIKAKLAEWQIIAEQYNSRTTHCSRTAVDLKSQWESMKKVARKDAANNRKHMIQTGGGPPIPPKKEDPLQQRIISLIATSAIGLFNPYDNDSSVPAVQDQGAMDTVQKDFPEVPQIQYIDIAIPQTTVVLNSPTSDTDGVYENQESVTKDWGDYTPQKLRTPVSQVLKNISSRRRPTQTTTSSSLEQLYKKKIEAIELQTKLAVEEMERSKVRHDIDVKIKKQILIQEKLKTNILLLRQRKLLAFKKRFP